MKWTSQKLRYLEEHASDGAEAIAKHLGCSVSAVTNKASLYGISLRKRFWCARCGKVTYLELSPKTGWCKSCTKEANIPELEAQLDDMRKEYERERKLNQKRQSLYSAKNRYKEKLREKKKN